MTKTSVASRSPASFADVEEAVVEDHVVGHAELIGEALQGEPITLSVAAGDLGMGLAGHHEQDVRELWNQLGDRLDRHLDPLARRQQPERRHHEAVGGIASTRGGLALQWHRSRDVAVSDVADLGRRAVGHDVDTLGVGEARRDHQVACRMREHQHGRCPRTERGQHTRLALGRPRQHRVQRDGIGHGELAGKGQHVLAIAASVDAELVLDHDHVDPQPPDQTAPARP